MQCQLCLVYYKAERVKEKVQIGKDKETIIINRYCPHKDAIINAEDEGCDKYEPTKYFWCPGWESWVSTAECQSRQKKDKYKTCPCSLGIEVMSIQVEQPKPNPSPKKMLVVRKPKKLLVIRKPKKLLVIRRK